MTKLFVFPGFLVALAWLVLSVYGCGSTSAPISYYSLLGPEPVPAATGRFSQMALLIGPVTLPDVLKRSQIVTGRPGEHYQLSEHHRWSGEVDRDLSRAMGEYLSRRLGTERIGLYPERRFAPLSSQVALDVVAMDGGLGEEARLLVRWSFLNPETGIAELTGRSLCRMSPANDGYAAWVAAQRANIRCLGEEIVAALSTRAL